jgi:hypothetical protein
LLRCHVEKRPLLPAADRNAAAVEPAYYESNRQAPGPSGLPQVPHASGIISSEALDAAPNAVFECAANVDNFLCKSVPLHDGHATAGDEPRTSFSNSFPQEPHRYSNMGMRVKMQSD